VRLMAELTVYEKPTCTTCKNLFTLLTENGIDFERVNYHVDPLPESKIRELIAKTGGTAHDVLRKKEPIYKELGLDQREVSDDDLIKLMAEHPQLLQRPIVERGDRAVLARPVERALDLLEGSPRGGLTP
jgi:arsenate reductase (glutaredoxin)